MITLELFNPGTMKSKITAHNMLIQLTLAKILDIILKLFGQKLIKLDVEYHHTKMVNGIKLQLFVIMLKLVTLEVKLFIKREQLEVFVIKNHQNIQHYAILKAQKMTMKEKKTMIKMMMMKIINVKIIFHLVQLLKN